MALPPIYYHFFRFPLNYAKTLKLQDKINSIQLARRRTYGDHRDYLLLLEHRPVYTAGRRQKGKEMEYEEARLRSLGADFASTQRGGELTYHGPGQLVGYPLLDLGRSRTSPAISIRDYISNLQRTLQTHLLESHGIQYAPSEHTGVFLNDDDGDGRGGSAKTKIASIGVQVRHRLTTHGFALNVTPEPLPWFAEIVACGLADVKAGCIAGRSKTTPSEDITVADQVPGIVKTFGRIFERDMVPMNLNWSREDGPEDKEEVEDVIREIKDVESDGFTLKRYSPAMSGRMGSF